MSITSRSILSLFCDKTSQIVRVLVHFAVVLLRDSDTVVKLFWFEFEKSEYSHRFTVQ